MCRWGDFLIHGRPGVISDATRAALTTPATPTQWGAGVQYGLGEFVWEVFPLSGDAFSATEYYPLRVWEHGGNTLSFTSSLVVVPEHDVVVSILSNAASAVHSATQEAVLRAALAPLPAPSPIPEPTVDLAKVAALAGRYFDPHTAGEILITEGGAGGLQISIPAFEERGYRVEPDLIPNSTYVWFATMGELSFDLTFVVDAQGQLTPWLRARFFAARRSDEVNAEPRLE